MEDYDCFYTYERMVLMRKIALMKRFSDFQEYAKSFNIHHLSLRVSPESVLIRNPISAYPPWHFDFFEELYKQLSEEERHMYFPCLKLLYRMLLLKYRENPEMREKIMFIRRTFTLLLRSAEFIGPKTVSSLITECQKALNVDLCDFLKIVPVYYRSVVLRCFPNHRSVGFGWDIRNSRRLMPALLYLCRSVALIQYGHPYTFCPRYFRKRVLLLFCEESRAQIKGKLLKNEIRPSIIHCGSLRLQMAVEFLLAVFDETHGYARNILDLLWRAVPFPYISCTEMSSLLSPFFKGRVLLQEVCEEYRERNTLFEVPQVTQPRSLKHLARVQVRKCMCDANSIGDDTIDGLDIPLTLKDYLKLPFHEVYFDVVPKEYLTLSVGRRNIE